MGKTTMDEFNEREPSGPTDNKTVSATWDNDGEVKQEAVCAVCDALFSAPIDRPPIFCPPCKAALKHTINR